MPRPWGADNGVARESVMNQVLIRRGRAVVEDVPAPRIEPGTVLVRVVRSCVSIGTEMSGVRASGAPLWRRALEKPEQLKRLVDMVATEGVGKTRALVDAKLSTAQPTGYSAAGVVIDVGAGVTDLRAGDRVACAGAQCAHHAARIRVPRNLVVRLPDAMGFDDASTVTLGAIALQGLRRAAPTMGETFVVIGLGILGQLTVQLLRANGCRAIGVDLDPARVELARSLGMDTGLCGDDSRDIEAVARLTDGHGADGVIITAAAQSSEIISTAFRMCRRKGRVVLVGDVGLELDRSDLYAKELDFFISTSYGPGRYDTRYEEEGLDYPIGYVRWTENRNMAEYLRLVAAGAVRVRPLVQEVSPIAEASAVYARLGVDGPKPLMVLLAFPEEGADAAATVVANPASRPPRPGRVRVGLLGAGAFAKQGHLPNLAALNDLVELRAVASRTGHNALATATQFGAGYATTDIGKVLADRDIDAVVIATRHDGHARLVLQALAAGKHVLVEKPLALEPGELSEIRDFYAAEGDGAARPILLTGFNRRFSPFARRMRDLVARRSNPMIINYRMNAGYLPLDHWVHGPEGGGRNRGEACHVYDLFTFLTDARATEVSAQALRPTTGHYSSTDNFVATVSFEDGSVASLTYTALGSAAHPKERMEIFFDGQVIVLDDYRHLEVHGGSGKPLSSRRQDKGQRAILEQFATAVHASGEWPIPLWQQLQATELAFAVEAQLR